MRLMGNESEHVMMPRKAEAAKGSCHAAGLKEAKVRGARVWRSRAQTGRIASGV